ncbi:MAG: APC family permease [Candidatus Eremiobacteraeota bacterium]|nr:APC family permease [Candidatus Eremiobacteraeota bacterium]
MIGIGPLITIPLVLVALHGPLSLIAWVLGALVAACDGLVWAELGAALPHSGGLYAFFLRLFPPKTGRLLAFLFVWQFVLTTPFLLASGYIGFSQYATYLIPQLRGNDLGQHVLAVGIGLLTIALLARAITGVATIAIVLFGTATLTLAVVTLAAWTRFDAHQAFALASGGVGLVPFVAGLGSGLIITLYDYGGYNTVTSIGEEVIEPGRTMPRSIVLAVAIVAALYLALQTGVLGTIPWQALAGGAAGPPESAKFVASTVVERAWGVGAAGAVTILILATAFASTFALLLSASRVPFAAARDGLFLPAFARLHARDAYPIVSLISIGTLALAACFLPLDEIIAVVGVGVVVIGGVGAFAAILRLRRSDVPMPYRMPLFPLPPLVALAAWVYVLATAGTLAVGFTVVSLCAGAAVYFVLINRVGARGPGA